MNDHLYKFPLAIDCNVENIVVDDDFCLKEMSDIDRGDLFGIDSILLDEEGRAASFPQGANFDFNLVLWSDLNTRFKLYSSNYILFCKDRGSASDFNFALKLIGESWSSLYVGYGKGSAKIFLRPCYNGKVRLLINDEVLVALRRVLVLIKRQSNDSKLKIIREIWISSMSSDLRLETRFVELSTLLEMILLPNKASELSFRFALRLAKLAKHFSFGTCAEDVFEKAKKMYQIRSDLVHSGKTKNLVEHEAIAREFARVLILHYLESPEFFDEKNLDRICITM